jgi:hypothetical protein
MGALSWTTESMPRPWVLGACQHLFGQTSDKKPLRLLYVRTVGDDIAYLIYQPVRDA